MNKKLICAVLLTVGLFGCRKDSPARKVIDGEPIGETITALPVDAVQGFHLLEQDMLDVVVAIAKRTATLNPTYGDVTPIGGGVYQFVLGNSHYGSATVTFSFRNLSNAVIDPIAVPSSTATIKSIDINVTSTGPSFSGTAHFTLTLTTLGDVGSVMTLTGTDTLTGGGYSITVTLPGSPATFLGISGGTIQISGTGPGGPVQGTVIANTSHEYNGTLNWDGYNGEIHVKDNGQASLLLNNVRYFFG